MNQKLRLLSALCTAALLSTPAMADDEKPSAELSTWDANGDRMVTQQEWSDAVDGNDLFDRIDTNNNGIFDIEEATENSLDYDVSMDLDDGGTISRDEFTLGLYNQYDENGDDELDVDEFDAFASNDEGLLSTDDTQDADEEYESSQD